MRKKIPPYKSASTLLQRKSPRKNKILIVSSQYVFHFLVWVAFRYGFPILCYNVSCILSPWFFTRDSSTIVHLLVCLSCDHYHQYYHHCYNSFLIASSQFLIASSQLPHSSLIASSYLPHSQKTKVNPEVDESSGKYKYKCKSIFFVVSR